MCESNFEKVGKRELYLRDDVHNVESTGINSIGDITSCTHVSHALAYVLVHYEVYYYNTLLPCT